MLTLTVSVVSSARDLGVVADSRLTMADHVASVCCSMYYKLRQIRPILRSLSENAAKTLGEGRGRGFISSRLDYCNYTTLPTICIDESTECSGNGRTHHIHSDGNTLSDCQRPTTSRLEVCHARVEDTAGHYTAVYIR